MQLFRRADHRVVPWKNGRGTTVEIAVHPPTGSVQGFDWRLSMATIAEDGPFSSFPGVDRVLVLLEGHGVDLVSQAHTDRLRDHDLARFPGEREVTARLHRGPVRDLNLMVRRDAYTTDAEVRRIAGAADLGSGSPILVVGVAGAPSVAGYALEPGEALVVEGSVAAEGEGTVLVARLTPRVE